jgi:hypothetical protein
MTAMTLEPDWLHAVLSPRLPRRRERATLSLVPWNGGPSTGASELGLWACLELRRTGRTGTSTGVCLLFLPAQRETPPERALTYLEG